MNAQQASELAHKVNTESSTGQYNEIQQIIQTAAHNGLYEAHYFKSIREDVTEKLSKEGFKFNSFTDRDGITITITWSGKGSK